MRQLDVTPIVPNQQQASTSRQYGDDDDDRNEHSIMPKEEEGKGDWYETVTIVRGPLIVLIAMTVLIYPLIYQLVWMLSPWVWMAVMCVWIGMIVTVMDVYHRIQKSWMNNNNHQHQQLVLDDLLKSIFSIADGGIIASTVGGIIGCFTMYNLPLTPDQRCRIIQSCLPPQSSNSTSTTTGHDILMKPGGLWKFLQSLYKTSTTSDNHQFITPSSPVVPDNEETTKKDNDIPLLYYKSQKEKTTTTSTLPSDFIWNDDHVNVDTGCDNNDESDCSTLEEITTASSSNNNNNTITLLRSSSPITSYNNNNNNNNNNIGPMMLESKKDLNHDDPVQVFWSILTSEIGPQVGTQIINSINERTVQKVGMVSALALIIQWKQSPFVRRLFHNVAHGSLAATLLTTTVVSVTTILVANTTKHSASNTNNTQVTHRRISSWYSQLKHFFQKNKNNDNNSKRNRTMKGVLAIVAMLLTGYTTSSNRRRNHRRGIRY